MASTADPTGLDVAGMTRAQRAALPISTEIAQALAEQHGVCIRPLAMRRIDTTTGRIDIVPVPCGSTREDQCPPCAEKARRLRMAQCRQGWHLEQEPVTERAKPSEEHKELMATRADLLAAYTECKTHGDEITCEQIADSITELDTALRATGVRGRLTPLDPPPKPLKRTTRRRHDAMASMIPNSRATRAIGFPVSLTIRTAPSLSWIHLTSTDHFRTSWIPRAWNPGPRPLPGAGINRLGRICDQAAAGHQHAVACAPRRSADRMVTADEVYGQRFRDGPPTHPTGVLRAGIRSDDTLPLPGHRRRLARSLATEIPAAACERRSAGAGAHGLRLYDWATVAADPLALPAQRGRGVAAGVGGGIQRALRTSVVAWG
jgi:hypothetical protein